MPEPIQNALLALAFLACGGLHIVLRLLSLHLCNEYPSLPKKKKKKKVPDPNMLFAHGSEAILQPRECHLHTGKTSVASHFGLYIICRRRSLTLTAAGHLSVTIMALMMSSIAFSRTRSPLLLSRISISKGLASLHPLLLSVPGNHPAPLRLPSSSTYCRRVLRQKLHAVMKAW